MNTSQQYATNQPLTSWAAAWYSMSSKACRDIAEFIAPCVQTAMQGEYKKYSRADGFHLVDTLTPAHMPARLIDTEGEDVPFTLKKHSLRFGITDEQAASAGAALPQQRRVKLAKLMGDFRRAHIYNVLKMVSKVPATEKNYYATTGTPLEDLKAMIYNFDLANGVKPNRMVISQPAWNIIQGTEEVQSELTFNRTRTLTPALLAEILGYSNTVDFEIRIATIPYTVEKGNTAAANVNMMGNDLLLFYVSDLPNEEDMSAFKTLCLSGDAFFEDAETKHDDDNDAEYTRIKSYILPVHATDAVARWTITATAPQND